MSLDPYSTPATSPELSSGTFGDDLSLTLPEPPRKLDIGLIVSEAWNLTKKNFWLIIGFGAVYFITATIANTIIAIPFGASAALFSDSESAAPGIISQIIMQVAQAVVSVFLGLGALRFGLNIVDGKPASIGDLFGQGKYFVRGIGAYFLYMIAVVIGILLLIVPGVYVALKYQYYMAGILDKNLGIKEAFIYSGNVTRDNKGMLLLLGIVAFLVILAGLIALIVGVVVAAPVAFLMPILAYRFLQGRVGYDQAQNVQPATQVEAG